MNTPVLSVRCWLLLLIVTLTMPLWSSTAWAIPAFARRHEMSCSSCHQGHYPRLNALGQRFRDNGYQLPEGAEEFARIARSVELNTSREELAVFKEVPLSVRGEVFQLMPVDGEASGKNDLETSVFSFIMGGGTVAKDVSYFFTWTPFPNPMLHQARVGFHNIGRKALGEGTLNVRAGSIFLLDLQRPSHRFLSAAPAPATSVTVGNNTFSLADANLGVQAYGTPGLGPMKYSFAVVTGDTGGTGVEKDDAKDLYGRVGWTFFKDTDHQFTPGVWGYSGRSLIETELTGLSVRQRDDFWMLGGDAEVDVGPVNLSGLGYTRRDSDPGLSGEPVRLFAGRVEALWVLTRKLTSSVRYEQVSSADDPRLNQQLLAPHLTYSLHPNTLLSATWRQDLRDFNKSTAVASVDVTF